MPMPVLSVHLYLTVRKILGIQLLVVIVIVAAKNIPKIILSNAAELTVLGPIKIRRPITRLSWERQNCVH